MALHGAAASAPRTAVNAAVQLTGSSLALAPTYGVVGQAVAASGTGLTPGVGIGFDVGGAWASSACTTDSNGTFPGTTGTSCSFTVPQVPAGARTVTAMQATLRVGDRVGNNPRGIAYDAGTSELFVANTGDSTVSVVGAVNGTAVATIGVGSYPVGVAYDAGHGQVWVTDALSNAVTVINDSNDSVATTVGVGSDPAGIAYDPVAGQIFVTNYVGTNVTVINDTTDLTVASIPVGSYASGVAYLAGLQEDVVANGGSDNVSFISDRTDTVVSSVGVGASPYGTPAFDPTTDQLFVANAGSSNVSILNASLRLVIANDPVGSIPTGCAFDAATNNVYVSDYGSNNATVIHLPADTVLGNVSVGRNPYNAPAYDPASTGIFVTNYNSNNVTILAGPPRLTATATFTVHPSVYLSPRSGTGGTSVYATGYGFRASATISFAVGVYRTPASCGSDSAGTFPGATGSTCVFKVPVMPGGTWNVSASDGKYSALTPFQVVPGLELEPSSGALGSTVAALGSGFASNATVSFTFGGVPVNSSCGTNARGGLSGPNGSACAFTVPSVPVGSATVSATDGTNVANASFDVIPALVLAPASGPAGAPVVARGSGFAANQSISVTFGGTALAWNCSSDGSGAFPGASGTPCSFVVPSGSNGAVDVTVTDGTNVASAGFLVTASFALSNHNGTVGAALAASGVGFPPGSNLTITVDGAPAIGGCLANVTGGFSVGSGGCSFRVPAVPAGNQSVEVTALNSTPSSVGVGNNPLGVAYDPSTHEIWVVDAGDDQVVILSDISGKHVASVPVGSFPVGIAYDSAHHEMFVTNALDDTVSVVADSNDTVVATIPVGSDPHAIAYDAAKGRLFVANYVGDNVTVINDTRDATIASIGVGSTPAGIVLDAADGRLFVPNAYSDNLSILSASTDRVVGSVGVGSGPYGNPAFDPSTGQVFVTDASSANVTIIDAANGTEAGSLPTSSHPVGAMYDPAGGLVLVANYISDNVTVIDAASDSELPNISVGSNPYGWMAFDPETAEMFVTNYNSNDVSVVASVVGSSWFTVNSSVAVAGHAKGLDVGQIVTVDAYGFGSSSAFAVFALGGLSLTCANATVGACANGTLTTDQLGSAVARFRVPSLGTGGRYQLTLTDAAGNTASTWLVVYSDPNASAPSASPPSVDLGQSTTFSTTASAGSGGYSYTWSGLPAGCTGRGANFSCTPYRAGFSNITVDVTDSNGFSAASGPLEFRVFSDPVAKAPTASRRSGTVDQGQSVAFTASASGGTGMYGSVDWSGLPAGCSGTSITVTCSAAQLPAGTYGISVTVTDSNGYTSAPSGVLTFTVDPDPTIGTISASAPSADAGQTVTFSVGVGGGSGTYNLSWGGFPSGCATLGTTETCSFASAATFSGTATVTDSNGGSITSAPLRYVVNADPTVSLALSPARLDRGASLVLTATPEYGSGRFTFTWSGLPAGCAGTTATLLCTPTATGTFSLRVAASDSNGLTAVSAPVVLAIGPALSAQLSSSTTAPTVGENVSFHAAVAGGIAPDSLTWSFGDGGTATNASSGVVHVYAHPGLYAVSLWVNDSAGGSVETTLNVTVAAASAAPNSGLGGGNGGMLQAWAIGIGVVAAIGVGSAVFVLRKRRRPRRTESTDVEPNPAESTEPVAEAPPDDSLGWQ